MQADQDARRIDPLLLVAGLSFAVALVNVGDTVARLLSFYVLALRYPFGIELKPTFAALQLLCAVWFLWASGPIRRGLPREQRGRSWEFQPILLGLLTALFVLEVGGLGRYADPYELATDFFWTLAFLALAYLVWDLRGVVRGQNPGLPWWVDLFFVALALVFVTRSLEFFYYWTQTMFGVGQPAWVAELSLYGPHGLGVLALGLLWWWARGRTVRAGRRPLWRDLLLGGLVGLAALVPPLLSVAGGELPEIVIRAFVFYSLGYSGYEWPSASLFLAAMPLYGDALASLWPGRGAPPAHWLRWLGIASLPWNGITTLTFGYTSIPGSIVALGAVLLGMSLTRAAPEKRIPSSDTGDQLSQRTGPGKSAGAADEPSTTSPDARS